MSLLAQAEGYTGASHPGLNKNASYHRMVYEDRSGLLDFNKSRGLIGEMVQKFRTSDRSRLVVRFLYSDSQDTGLRTLAQYVASLGGQLGYYQNYQPDTAPFSYVTVSLNNQYRMIDSQSLERLTLKNKQYIVKLLGEIEPFGEYNLRKLEDFRKKGFTLTRSMEAGELVSLWGETFGWSKEACENLLSSIDGSFPLGVRNSTGELIAVVLYSHQPHILENGEFIRHGETTEASTLPQYQGNGIMPILVTGLHVELFSQGIYNVYGELRAEDITGDKPNSINHGIKSGKMFHFPQEVSPLLVNHVSIAGNGESYNISRAIPGYDSSPPQELRSFLLGSMNPSTLSQRIRDSYHGIIS